MENVSKKWLAVVVLLAGVSGLVFLLIFSRGKPDSNLKVFGARLTTSEITLFTTSTNANHSTNVVSNVNSFRHIEVTVAATTASGTLQFACSNQTSAPDFSASSSATNRWDYIEVVDKEDGATIDGDVGITLNATTDVRQFEINENYSTWCSALLSGNTSPAGIGTTSVYLKSAE